MDIQVYEDMVEAVKYCNSKINKNYGNVIVRYQTANSTYPHTVVREIRNKTLQGYGTRREKVSTLGYRITIFAKDKGTVSKQQIARELMKHIDDFMQYNIGLELVNMNEGDLENSNSDIYPIDLFYNTNWYENRRRIV